MGGMRWTEKDRRSIEELRRFLAKRYGGNIRPSVSRTVRWALSVARRVVKKNPRGR
jgi:hypothetical protein